MKDLDHTPSGNGPPPVRFLGGASQYREKEGRGDGAHHHIAPLMRRSGTTLYIAANRMVIKTNEAKKFSFAE